MKKFLLSGFIILTFIIYSVQQRHEMSTGVVPPTSLTTGTQSTQGSQSTPSSTSQSTPSSTTNTNNQQTTTYKDGKYVGDVTDALYGNIQVRATIQGGKITDVQFLQYPNDRSNSIWINQQAMPYLKQEAIKAQNSHVDIISGATDTSFAFIQSLSSALARAQ